ncbi:MAG: HesA/MoeB/ThiF family protein [Muribaculaceae bacterium]|nr:HesA/MoeB/ThiF family protein [Muribaculaceae bacterium]
MEQCNLTPEDMRRYSRTVMLPEIGEEGQRRLLASRVMVVGAGALGSIVSMYLAGAGVGTIEIADFDTVDLSNLQRQLSFEERNVGEIKVQATALRLRAINSGIRVIAHEEFIRRDRARELFSQADVVVEGSDNPSTKYMVSEVCVELGKACVLGGVAGWRGQVMTWAPGHSSYRDLYPEAADIGGCTPCSQGGVMGPVPGIVGSVQATEVIKLLTKSGTPLFDRLLTFDALDMQFDVFRL